MPIWGRRSKGRAARRGASETSEVDLGPLADLADEVRSGSLGLAAAKERARKLASGGNLDPQVVFALASASREATDTVGWRTTLPLAELAYEAADAAQEAEPGNPTVAEVLVFSGAQVLALLHVGLFELGDIRLYLRAHEVADRVLPTSREFGLRTLQGLVSLYLGTLILDAYTTNRSPAGWEVQFRHWVERAVQTDDPELKRLMSVELFAEHEGGAAVTPARFPDRLEALAEAEALIRDALPLVVPERRGRALKALGQCLLWQGYFGGEVNPDDTRKVLESALAELDPGDTEPRASVVDMLQQLARTHEGHEDAPPTIDESVVTALETDLVGYVREKGQTATWFTISSTAASLQESDPVRGLALLHRQRELDRLWADEENRSNHFQVELALFSRAYRPRASDAAWGDGFDLAMDVARSAMGQASTPEQARTAAAAAVTVMLAATKLDREGEALALVDDLFALDSSMWSDTLEAAEVLLAGLLLGEGVNRMRAGDPTAAGRYYRHAADAYCTVRFGSAMTGCLKYLVDVVLQGTEELDELTAWLAAYSLHFEVLAPHAAPNVTHDLASALLTAQASKGTAPEVLHLLLQVAKGRRFTAMLATGAEDFELDDQVRALLEQEATAESRLPPDSDVLRPHPFDAALGEDDLISAWIDEFEEGPSETPADKVANLQRVCESRLTAAMTPRSWPPMPSLADIRERLDEDTALLELFEGTWAGQVASWQLLVTKDGSRAAVGSEQMPSSSIQASWGGRSVTMPASGFLVGELRRALQEDPTSLDVSPSATSLLSNAATRYARVLEEAREELLAAGIRKVVVAPHGSSRFVPIHLAGPDGHPLADQWDIRYVLSTGQLGTTRQRESRSGAAVFALSYADQPSLPALADSRGEAEAIAAVCGTTPLLDAEATEPAVIDALTSCRYVHLRAHGRLYVDAPSFHTVFLHPSKGYDGRLRAYEVPRLNLAGLDLVTLGACETALTRVDRSDNPRGLPAALILAGARAVIGTLWPVLAGASSYFFTSLYGDLLSNGGDVSASFVVAQRATRKQFPQYRDWGAFYLIGDC